MFGFDIYDNFVKKVEIRGQRTLLLMSATLEIDNITPKFGQKLINKLHQEL